jgi:hypothetical protein
MESLNLDRVTSKPRIFTRNLAISMFMKEKITQETLQVILWLSLFNLKDVWQHLFFISPL